MGQEPTAITNIISFNPPNNNMSYIILIFIVEETDTEKLRSLVQGYTASEKTRI